MYVLIFGPSHIPVVFTEKVWPLIRRVKSWMDGAGSVYGPGSYLGKMPEAPPAWKEGTWMHSHRRTPENQGSRLPWIHKHRCSGGWRRRGDQEDESSAPREANQMVTNKAKWVLRKPRGQGLSARMFVSKCLCVRRAGLELGRLYWRRGTWAGPGSGY